MIATCEAWRGSTRARRRSDTAAVVSYCEPAVVVVVVVVVLVADTLKNDILRFIISLGGIDKRIVIESRKVFCVLWCKNILVHGIFSRKFC